MPPKGAPTLRWAGLARTREAARTAQRSRRRIPLKQGDPPVTAAGCHSIDSICPPVRGAQVLCFVSARPNLVDHRSDAARSPTAAVFSSSPRMGLPAHPVTSSPQTLMRSEHILRAVQQDLGRSDWHAKTCHG